MSKTGLFGFPLEENYNENVKEKEEESSSSEEEPEEEKKNRTKRNLLVLKRLSFINFLVKTSSELLSVIISVKYVISKSKLS